MDSKTYYTVSTHCQLCRYWAKPRKEDKCHPRLNIRIPASTQSDSGGKEDTEFPDPRSITCHFNLVNKSRKRR
ncbi:hypothetical protein JTE90_014649 [Oedothorax gibbosus]|uniref:Uncharacterized protein n=1 Tax=Oedothorax gibbosus TaxID=931172 RepID=A0AAV6VAZ7_9ARAC|nr:hypothetical protein JTE90_014649 [Oedothorax gibbosus]